MLHAVIMAGGGGTRFWPRSRSSHPKQFLALAGDRSLLQQAYDRLESLVSPARVWVITGERHHDETARQLPTLTAGHVVGEPVGRDTAPCIGLGAALLTRQDPEAVMLVTPADHVIEPADEFRRAVHVAEQIADERKSALITFGIPPTYPATGYGYIHRGKELDRRQGIGIFEVRQFKEKPDRPTAERLATSGEYYWNSGIFVWKAATILDGLRQNQPKLHDAVQRIADAWDTPDRQAVLAREYEAMERISIDYAVMERAADVLVVDAPFRWDDVGSWLAVERMNPQDADGNTVLAKHAGLRTKNCVIVGDPAQFITTIGIQDLLIVQAGDAILIADRHDEGAVKELVEHLKKHGHEAFL
jgi:mannose-1-phosphate guanylyltransferase